MIVIVAGVSGSGKTTVGRLLAARFGWPYEDGDALHPAANIAKMAAGIPLTDADRRPWLAAIATWLDARIRDGQPGVLACSALKRRYRDFLLNGRPSVRIAFLEADRDVIAARLAGRHGHFFDPDLLDSQFAALEPPSAGETSVTVIHECGEPEAIEDDVIRRLRLNAGQAAGSAARGARAEGPGSPAGCGR